MLILMNTILIFEEILIFPNKKCDAFFQVEHLQDHYSSTSCQPIPSE